MENDDIPECPACVTTDIEERDGMYVCLLCGHSWSKINGIPMDDDEGLVVPDGI